MEADTTRHPRARAWLDYACPFSWLADAQLDRLEREEGVAAVRIAWELHPPGSPPGTPPEEAFWESTLVPLARDLGLAGRRPDFLPRTRKAHEAVEWARLAGEGRALHRAVFRAFWEEGRDIGRIDVLVELVEAEGLDAQDARIALGLDTHAAAVAEAEAEAARLGVRGTPTVQGEERVLVGLHPYEELMDVVRPREDRT